MLEKANRLSFESIAVSADNIPLPSLSDDEGLNFSQKLSLFRHIEMTNPLVAKASTFAIDAHEAIGQRRTTGEAYWAHPQAIAAIVPRIPNLSPRLGFMALLKILQLLLTQLKLSSANESLRSSLISRMSRQMDI
jgi:hypothetical protein